jgi:hypothetical protein
VKDEKLNAFKFYYYSSLIKHADLHTKNIGALNIGNTKKLLEYDPLLINSTSNDFDSFVNKLGTLKDLDLEEFEAKKLPKNQLKYDKKNLL